MKKYLIHHLINLGLLVLGALLFSFAFPSFLDDWGWGWMAFFSLIPVFWIMKRNHWLVNALLGFLYGFLTYKIFNFWLAEFNPIAHQVVPLVYAVYFMIVFPITGWAVQKKPKHSWWIFVVFWIAYEVIRTKGFLGYAYGIIAYTQYDFLTFIGISDITGVLGVSALVVLPQALIVWRLMNPVEDKKVLAWVKPMGIYAGVFVLANLYGWLAMVDYSDAPVWRPALVQHNEDAWLNGIEIYKKSFELLVGFSDEALEEDPDVVIWSESAFVPAIEWHEKYRREQEKLVLIQRLREYFESRNSAFIIGNNDSRMILGEKKSWNAVLLFEGREIVDRYHKIHLVPFGEHFPYERLFPRFHQLIVDNGVPFYEKGEEFNLMETGGVSFGSLICFEDTFPYLARNFTREGAQVLVNLTNDAWSKANASCIQHGTIAVFRSVENRRSMVRSTCAGLTTAIDPNGRMISYLEPFTEGYLIEDVPLYTERTTLFTRLGSWFDWLNVAGAIFSIAWISISEYLKRRKETQE